MHFEGKKALEHVIERQKQGVLDSVEIHGTEIPGHISAGCDAARETAVVLSLLWIIIIKAGLSPMVLVLFSIGWLLWKSGRSAWLAWARLERLHRIMEEERWEIEHHRPQEREELVVLYRAKGFEGKLLEDVVDVLMADGDRLLRVMLQEELGLSLESHEHPLKQGVGAAIGTITASVFSLLTYWIFPPAGFIFGAVCILAAGGAISAYYQKNEMIPAIIWNIGIGALSFGVCYFLYTMCIFNL